MSIKKEILIFLIIFLISSLIVHFDSWVNTPISHISNLSAHPLSIHPILYTLFIYIVVLVLRGILLLIKRIFKN